MTDEMTLDGQRMISTEEVDVDGETVTNTTDRPATLDEQVAHFADEILAHAKGVVTLANSGTASASGSTLMIELSADLPGEGAEVAPQAAPARAKASTSSEK